MSRLLRRKLRRDIAANPGQFIMMTLAVLLSVFALSTLLGALVGIQRVTSQAYLGTNPAHATIETDGTKALPENPQLPGAIGELRGSLVGRIQNPQGQWFPLVLFVFEDFRQAKIGVPEADTGPWPPVDGTIALERTAMELIGAKIGQNLPIILPHSPAKQIMISTNAHDAGLAPAWQERTAYGYASLATARQLMGEQFQLAELKVVWTDPNLSIQSLRQNSDALASSLESQGYAIEEIQVPPPRMHPHQSQSNTILSIFLTFAILALVLSGVLLAAMLRSLLARETRGIGIMKSLGAGPWPLIRHYLGMALAPAAVGTLIALPLGFICAGQLAGVVTGLLNFSAGIPTIPPWTLAPPLAAGLLIPSLITLAPILNALKISVRSALEGQRPAPAKTGQSKTRLPRIITLAIGNITRQRASLVLNLSLLAVSALLFTSSLNIAASWESTLKAGNAQKRYDLEIRLEAPLPSQSALDHLREIKSIAAVEAWPRQEIYPANGYRHPITGQYPDQGHGSFYLRPFLADSQLIRPVFSQGPNWNTAAIQPGSIMLNPSGLANFPGAKIGSTISLLVNGQVRQFKLVSLVKEIAPASAWVLPADYPEAGIKASNNFLISYRGNIAKTDRSITAAVETAIASLGGKLELALPQSEFDLALGGHVWILIVALVAMAVIIGIVGLIGLSATAGASVLDRTREIGIMRAIGASPATIRSLILSESGFLALGALIIALACSWPLSQVFSGIFGQMAFRMPLDTTINPVGVVICAIMLPLGALGASLGAAGQAAKNNVRQALAYE